MITTRLHLKRTNHTLESCTGELHINGKFFCYTLEDTVRGTGIKIPKHTALPIGKYKVALTMSARFKRLLPLIFTNEENLRCEHDGKSFAGVRFHGGNSHQDTEGCPLVAFKKMSNDRIYDSASKELVEILSEAHEITLTITN